MLQRGAKAIDPERSPLKIGLRPADLDLHYRGRSLTGSLEGPPSIRLPSRGLGLDERFGGDPVALGRAFGISFLEPQEIGNLADTFVAVIHACPRLKFPLERRFASAWRRPFLPLPIDSRTIARPPQRRPSVRPCARRDGPSTCRGPIHPPASRRHRPC